MLQTVLKFFKYWWFRYMLVTELYMVEKWERVAIHIIFTVFFALLLLFNVYIVLNVAGFWVRMHWSLIKNLNSGLQEVSLPAFFDPPFIK